MGDPFRKFYTPHSLYSGCGVFFVARLRGEGSAFEATREGTLGLAKSLPL
jgi:hypothetical protein